MREDEERFRALLDEWLQDGSRKAFDGLMNRFSASYHKHDKDGLIAFKEFLLTLLGPDKATSSEGREDTPEEPPIDFTGPI